MIEALDKLWVGKKEDTGKWNPIHPTLAATKTVHQEFVGYTSHKTPRPCPEYLFAVRANDLALNMVDAVIPNELMVQVGMQFIDEYYRRGIPLLIYCNFGMSRSKYIAARYINNWFPHISVDEVNKRLVLTTMNPILYDILLANWKTQ